MAVSIAGLIELLVIPIATLAIQRAPAATLICIAFLIPLFIASIATHAAHIAKEPTSRFDSGMRVVLACVGFVVISGILSTPVEIARDRYLGEPFRVPSAAMIPALLIGDHFYTTSLVHPDSDLKRGDVAVFRIARDGRARYPVDRRPDLPTETFVKRIVGLPGDTVELDGALLRINGELITGPPLKETFALPNGRRLPLRTENLGSRSYKVLDDPNQSSMAIEMTVEPNRFFFAGDNRLNSNDSRYWGTVHRDDIIGKVATVYWSWDFNGNWFELLSPARWIHLLSYKTRWNRIGESP